MKMSSLNLKFDPPRRTKFVSGAALMLALWALFLLSAMVISWCVDIDSRVTLSGDENRGLAAEAMAASGAEVALHPSVKPGSPNLHRALGAREGYDVRITGEGGRLNLNWLTAGEDPIRLEILRKYLELKGGDLNERDRMMDGNQLFPDVRLSDEVRHLGAPSRAEHPSAGRAHSHPIH